MNCSLALRTCLTTKLLNIKDRASRSEFWWFTLFAVPINLILSFWYTNSIGSPSKFFMLVMGPISLFWIVAWLNVGCRRLHDMGMNGMWSSIGIFSFLFVIYTPFFWTVGLEYSNIDQLLLLFILIAAFLTACVVAVVFIILYATTGIIGPNPYGPDPVTHHLPNFGTQPYLQGYPQAYQQGYPQIYQQGYPQAYGRFSPQAVSQTYLQASSQVYPQAYSGPLNPYQAPQAHQAPSSAFNPVQLQTMQLRPTPYQASTNQATPQTSLQNPVQTQATPQFMAPNLTPHQEPNQAQSSNQAQGQTSSQDQSSPMAAFGKHELQNHNAQQNAIHDVSSYPQPEVTGYAGPTSNSACNLISQQQSLRDPDYPAFETSEAYEAYEASTDQQQSPTFQINKIKQALLTQNASLFKAQANLYVTTNLDDVPLQAQTLSNFAQSPERLSSLSAQAAPRSNDPLPTTRSNITTVDATGGDTTQSDASRSDKTKEDESKPAIAQQEQWFDVTDIPLSKLSADELRRIGFVPIESMDEVKSISDKA